MTDVLWCWQIRYRKKTNLLLHSTILKVYFGEASKKPRITLEIRQLSEAESSCIIVFTTLVPKILFFQSLKIKHEELNGM